jgi:hypothetical protein
MLYSPDNTLLKALVDWCPNLSLWSTEAKAMEKDVNMNWNEHSDKYGEGCYLWNALGIE